MLILYYKALLSECCFFSAEPTFSHFYFAIFSADLSSFRVNPRIMKIDGKKRKRRLIRFNKKEKED
jgi:hypothetical protein